MEGKRHPDRDSQFKFTARGVQARFRRGEPAIFIDTKMMVNLIGSTKTEVGSEVHAWLDEETT